MRIELSDEAAALIKKHKLQFETNRDVLDRLLGLTRLKILKDSKPDGFEWICDSELTIDPEGYVDLHFDYPDGIRFSVPYRGIAR
jgi:hypothetical protein